MHLLMRSLQLLKPQVQLHRQLRDKQVIKIMLPSDTINIRGWDPLEFVWWVWFRKLHQRSWPACWLDLPMKSGAAAVLIHSSYGWTDAESYDEDVRRQLLEICEPYLITGENAA